ncbi:MAG TPA: hypothetical protein VEL11_15995, partial [Candidatus Bathyarchaeia archaeon]|nr:hypothetical protein [Candidatus Bathyarchaeia archaeon]
HQIVGQVGFLCYGFPYPSSDSKPSTFPRQFNLLGNILGLPSITDYSSRRNSLYGVEQRYCSN